MLMCGMLHRLLLAGTFLCVCGTPVHLSDLTPTQDSNCDGQCASSLTTVGSTHGTGVKSKPSDTDHGVFGSSEHVDGLVLNLGAGGGVGPHGGKTRPEGIAPVTQTENGDSLDRRSGPSEAGRKAWSQRREIKKVGGTSEIGDAHRQAETASVLSIDPQSKPGSDEDTKKPLSASTGDKKQQDMAKLTSQGTLPPAVFISPRTSTPLSIWGHEGGATMSTLPDPLLPEMGPNLMPKEDGPESLWTEASRPSGADTVVPLSQDEATEGTMSSESLPLIFEPFEDVAPEGTVGAAAAAAVVTLLPGSATGGMPLSEVDLEQLVTVETDPPLLIPDWASPCQTSGAELLEPISSSGPTVSQQPTGTETGPEQFERGAMRTPNLDENLPTTGPSHSSFQRSMTTVTMVTHQPVPKSRSALDEMESDEETDEDEDDENSEESVEEESDEDLTETPNTSSTPPPYSLIPPPPVWVQRNQGLMRSWVELIREKAGYVSGMLAPRGHRITGALLIVGALYSIRMIHRKRRNSFKHQRRKVRQPEQPREPGTSRQDQAMLLADSSEDEF
ncbi:armadillo-like helical domain-containing protein 4 isoform X3 [Sphaeramia orbicularis]|uniref:armadillo-like helical domain-containing protein 4 isoform X3 n=1 Tax=Sphaeramia orbicularis TaxID=375764 RepID=UPI0011808B4B|nr:armadillo-like helical domain-containing protein 4 isoform X3 [Sphaeramia orbicularis]